MSAPPRPFWARRMAELRRRARLTPAETAAAVALTEAQVGGLVLNAKSFRRRADDETTWRIELEVTADKVEALLSALESP
jgi:hypothetical protein